MARINVEDTLWSDPRFMRLVAKTGNEFTAAGMVLCAWKVAQRFWCPDQKGIPEDVFKESGLPELIIEVSLAERTTNGIRMKGSEQHFAWWFDARSAGQASAEARKKKYGSAQPTQKNLERQSNGVRTPFERKSNSPEPPTLTLNTKDLSNEVDLSLQVMSKGAGAPPPHVVFQRVWERWVGKLGGAHIVSWNPGRKAAAKARWSEKPEEKFWDSVLEKATQNPFYRGEVAPSNGYRRFKADIDWLLAPKTWIKILERETVTKKERKVVGHTPDGEPVYG